MPAKASTHIFKNMVRDMNPMSTNSSSLYNAYNIRFTSDEEQTFGSITNEKGTKLINDVVISGTYLSHYTVDKYLMVFTIVPSIIEGEYGTNIYRIECQDNTWTVDLLVNGLDLNMDLEHPLEFTSYYEGEDVIKIYWVDGKNQLRFMNVCRDDYSEATENDFNVLPKLELQERVSVEQINGNGIFPAGVIQYAFTYINRMGAESNIFYTTKLKSIQYEDRAGHPEIPINCCFKITIDGLDTEFDYVRCYQLIRTHLDQQPLCKILNEVPINKDAKSVTIIDTNVGADYDPTALLFPKYPIIPYTLEQKSNTLFLGNIKEIELELTDDDISKVRRYFNKYATYTPPHIPGEPEPAPGYFPILRFSNLNQDTYECLDRDGYVVNTDADIIRTFKSRETYRIGVQLQDEYGCWTEPIYLKDIDVTCKQKQEGIYVTPISLMFDVSKADAFPELSREFKKFRLLMVNPTAIDRETFDQGIIVPTLYEVSDRMDNTPFSYNSWYIRPQCGGIEFRHNLRTPNAVDDGTTGETLAAHSSSIYSYSRAQTSEDQVISDVKMVLDLKFKRGYGHSHVEDGHLIGRISAELINCQVTSTTAQLIDTAISGTSPLALFEDLNLDNDNTITPAQKQQVANGFVQFVNQTQYSETLYRHLADLYDEESEPKLSTLVYNKLLAEDITVIGRLNDHPEDDGTGQYMTHDTVKVSITIKFENIDVTDYCVGPIDPDNSIYYQTCAFHIDHSVLNLYSPVIDDDYYVVDNNRLNLDLIGYTNISKINEDVFVSMKTSGAGPNSGVENKNNIVDIRNIKLYNVNSKFLFRDTIVSQKVSETDAQVMQSYSNYIVGRNNVGQYEQVYYVDYLVAPWHKSSFNNEDNTYGDIRSAVYERKVYGRMFTTDSAHYFNFPILHKKVTQEGEDVFIPITSEEYQTPDILKVCNSTTPLKTFMQDNTLRTYLPNVDIARSFSRDKYGIPVLKEDDNTITTVEAIDATARANTTDMDKVHLADSTYSGIIKATDPIQIRYLSDTHVLIPFNRKSIVVDDDNCKCLFRLPNLSSRDIDYTEAIPHTGRSSRGTSTVSGQVPINPYYPVWDPYNKYVDYDCYIFDGGERVVTDSPYVLIGELHREVENKYGGDIDISDMPPIDPDEPYVYDRNDPVLISNIYIPISESISIEGLNTAQKISTTYGDTWYGRWDCLKTQERADQDQQSVHDYISVMIESHMNLNGRYDEYRNYSDWTVVNQQLSNKFNPVYNQMDNFWNYKVVPFYIKSYVRPNQITWSLTKSSGSLVDEWTKVTESAIYEMDGTKGSVNKIINYKDSLLIFQDKCLSQLLYNEQMQLTTTEGIPVEISNSQKVTGKRVLYDNTGCVNKWSICSTQDALFFVDNYNKAIIAYNPDYRQSREEPIINITAQFGFDTFMKKENSLSVWNPKDFSNFVTFQDSLRKDIYFVNKYNCLGYSNLLNGFTSFYSYEQTPAMFNYKDRFFSFKNNLLYELFADKYNNIYGQIQPSKIEFIDTGQEDEKDGTSIFVDKTYTVLSYMQDAFDVSGADTITDDYINKDYIYLPDRTFNTLRVHTPFQDTGNIALNSITSDGESSNLQRKFRTWNIQIPRCASTLFSSDTFDRIRNNWAKFTLTFQPSYNENTKIELFGINVYNLN